MIEILELQPRQGAEDAVLQGHVKWFDPDRGFGFVRSERTGRDVLLHGNVLHDFGHSSVASDSRLTLRVRHGARGLRAVEVLCVEAPDPSLPSGGEEGRPDYLQPVDEAMPYLPARVKWFDRDKGFGFATVFDQDGDVFIHAEVLRRSGFEDLQQGEAICLRAVDGARGPLALEVRRWSAPDSRVA